MDKIDKIFYINLERRKDRDVHFNETCSKDAQMPLNKIERFNALDGKTYVPTKEESNMFLNCSYLNKKIYNNVLCNQLGHYYILKEIIKRQYNYAMVCQDDVKFRPDFQMHFECLMNHFPSDAEMVNIGLHKHARYSHFVPYDLTRSQNDDYAVIGKSKTNIHVCKLRDQINPCSLAYIVTLQGAINLVEHFDNEGFKRETDWNFNEYLRDKDIFYCSLPVLCTGNSDLKSDIFDSSS